MRVLFFNYEYPPLGAGAANATACILEEYSKIPNLEVDLVTSSIDADYHLETITGNIKIHKLPIGKDKNNLHYQSKGNLLAYSWKAYLFSRSLAKKNRYELSHSFFTVPCGFLSLLLKWQFNIPYIVSLRGADVPGYSERFSRLYLFLTPIIKLIWKNAFAVVANSEGLKDLALKAKPDQKIEVIYNGVDINHFKPGQGLENNEKFIITIGASRITVRKGIKYLIEAVNKLLPKYSSIHLKLIGEGNDKNNLEKLVEKLGIGNNVEFLGRIPREKTAPYYQEASLFVLPSFNEGMSNAMLEALASGLPVIATKTGGTSELVKENVNGYIIKMKDSDDIAEKIEKLILDEKLRQRMGEASRSLAEKFSWKNIAGQYAAIYERIN